MSDNLLPINSNSNEEISIEDEVIENLKKNLQVNIDSHYKSEFRPEYEIATFLDPGYKFLIQKDLRQEILQFATRHGIAAPESNVIKFIIQLNITHLIKSIVEEQEEPKSKLAKLRNSCSTYQQSNEVHSIMAEIANYCSDTTSIQADSLLQFWNSSPYPLLKRIARKILAIPASSAGSERRFSFAGKVQTISRAKLAPEKLCAQTVVANYLKNNIK